MPQLWCFGLGYVASHLARLMQIHGFMVKGTCRSREKQQQLKQQAMEAICYDHSQPDQVPSLADYQQVTHILLSIPPEDAGDPVYRDYLDWMKALPSLKWVGYLSTTGVYGDQQGAWVTEDTPTAPMHQKAKNRVMAEQQWLQSGLPVQIFRLSGIYGPGRSVVESLRQGTAKRIYKEGQVFSRMHVTDIAMTLKAAMGQPEIRAGEIYNLADDEPEAQEKVVAYAAGLLGMEPPPLVPFEKADLSPMAKEFYGSCRRVCNKKIKENLAISLSYPSYKEGVDMICEWL